MVLNYSSEVTTKMELKLRPSWSVLHMEETLWIIEQKKQNLVPGEVEVNEPQTLIKTSETSL